MALWDAKCERCACRRVRAVGQWVGAVGAEAVQQEAEVRRQAADRFGELKNGPRYGGTMASARLGRVGVAVTDCHHPDGCGDP